jgi:hypothetical protein
MYKLIDDLIGSVYVECTLEQALYYKERFPELTIEIQPAE